jgi:hypothetical protein
MPYYLFRIFKDGTNNQIVKAYESFLEAQKQEEQLNAVSYSENYFLRVVCAKNEEEAEEKAKKTCRREI